MQPGEPIARRAAGGVRLVVDNLRTDVTKTRKHGSRGQPLSNTSRTARSRSSSTYFFGAGIAVASPFSRQNLAWTSPSNAA
jgi:hypothetical protein